MKPSEVHFRFLEKALEEIEYELTEVTVTREKISLIYEKAEDSDRFLEIEVDRDAAEVWSWYGTNHAPLVAKEIGIVSKLFDYLRTVTPND